MQLAFSVYDFTLQDGIQSDCRILLEECVRRGHVCRLYCRDWNAQPLQDVEMLRVPSKGLSKAAQRRHFNDWVQKHRADNPVDGLIGFNPMPGLDLYVASDLSIDETTSRRAQGRKAYKQHREWLQVICTENTSALLYSDLQKQHLQQQFALQEMCAHVLPVGIAPDWQPPDQLRERRKSIRAELNIEEGEFVLLFAATDIESGGFERALAALSQLQVDQPGVKSRLLVIGPENEKNVLRQVKRAELTGVVTFLETWAGVENAMCAADTLIHPVREDHRGELPLKSLAMGLPVVTVDVCESATNIVEGKAGLVVASPFDQLELNKAVMRCIDGIYRADRREAGLLYAQRTDLGARFKVAAALIEKLIT